MAAPFRSPRQRPPWATTADSSDPFPGSSPDLPLPRYDHRRLTARDVLVHRLMAQFMAPTPANAHIFDEIWDREFSIASLEPASPSPPSAARHELLLDLQVLDRLLYTTPSQLLPSQLAEPVWLAHLWGPAPSPPPYDPLTNPRTVGEHLLDLVLRHYFEIDDTALRLSISRVAPPRMPQGPRPASASRARADKRRCLEEQINSQRDSEGLVWGEPHLAVMKQLRHAMAAQNGLDLYDGGVLLPYLRRELDRFSYSAFGSGRFFNSSHPITKWGTDMAPHHPRYVHPNRHTLAMEQPSWHDREDLPITLRIPAATIIDRITRRYKANHRIHHARDLTGRAVDDPPSVQYTRRSRCVSEPPDGRFADALLQLSQKPTSRFRLQFLYPRMTLSQLDGRSRRRSLSRTRIDEMFDWGSNLGLSIDESAPAPAPRGSSKTPRCENCDSQYPCFPCLKPCGHCGAPSPHPASRFLPDAEYTPPGHTCAVPCDLHPHPNPHLAGACPVAPRNRCKCVAFPTMHTAAQCAVPCRGGCGNPAPPGSLRHRNAMTCRARCCMCGLRGHSGRECRLGRCRCGGAHLGQDCGWNPTCRVGGCDRFLCGVHCRECGSTEKPFVGWRCRGCLGFEGAGEGGEPVEEKRGRRRRRRRKGRRGDQPDGEGEAAAEKNDEAETVVVEEVPAVVAPLATSKETEPERDPARQQSLFGDPRTKNAPPRAGR